MSLMCGVKETFAPEVPFSRAQNIMSGCVGSGLWRETRMDEMYRISFYPSFSLFSLLLMFCILVLTIHNSCGTGSYVAAWLL